MNCANHNERTATGFCQNCGKPLCPECTRTLGNLILCEPCLQIRQAAAAGTQWNPAAGPSQPGVPPAASWTAVPGAPAPFPPYRVHASPVIAGFLGLIPGVGAMYNGQFIKALLHVVIFIVLIGASEHFPLMGILISAWVFYQVFDAAQTASARRDGRPLPDPFGILDMSQRLGSPGLHAAPGQGTNPPPAFYPGPVQTPTQGSSSNADASPNARPGAYGGAERAEVSGASSQGPAYPGAQTSYSQGYAAQGTPQEARAGWTPIPVSPPMQPYVPANRRGEPVGAVVLILVGLLFLLSTLGVLDFDWIERGWPVLLLLLGVWLLIRRVTGPAIPGMPVAPVAPPVASPPAGSYPPTPASGSDVLSITPHPYEPKPDEEEKR